MFLIWIYFEKWPVLLHGYINQFGHALLSYDHTKKYFNRFLKYSKSLIIYLIKQKSCLETMYLGLRIFYSCTLIICFLQPPRVRNTHNFMLFWRIVKLLSNAKLPSINEKKLYKKICVSKLKKCLLQMHRIYNGLNFSEIYNFQE